MEFSSYSFIFIFLPIALITYYLVKVISKNNSLAKNITLFVFSILFYAFGAGFIFLCITVGYLLIVYLLGLLTNKFNKHWYLILINVLASLSYLIVFKILVEVDKNIILPLAISFICFQSCAYLIDVSRKKISAEKNIINFITYSLLFTKLVSGPIMNYQSISEQLNNREENYDDFVSGVVRFSFGLAKKVLIASFIYEFEIGIADVDASYMSSLLSLFSIGAYSLYLYYDFSSYSDMAVGISKMFGFKIVENFNYPYTAFSVTDFWRRWHISLSLWFKEYVYFPLGGNRKGKIRTLLNVAIIFLLTGIWHGFNLTFLIFGAYYAIIMIIEKLFLYDLLNKNPIKPLNVIYTLAVVGFGWIIFRAESLEEMKIFLHALFKNDGPIRLLSYLNLKCVIGVVLGTLFIGFIQRPLKPILDKYQNNSVWRILTFSFSIVLIAISMFYVVSGSYSPSVYGGF